jgi:hypothetical protein
MTQGIWRGILLAVVAVEAQVFEIPETWNAGLLPGKTRRCPLLS